MYNGWVDIVLLACAVVCACEFEAALGRCFVCATVGKIVVT